MKKAINKARIITTALSIVFFLGCSQAAMSTSKDQSPVAFKFMGKQNAGPLFRLTMNNSEADEFLIKVKDADGILIYSEKLKGKNIDRKYQFAITDELYESFNVRFEITSTKTHETFVYKVSNSNHLVDDMIVAKL